MIGRDFDKKVEVIIKALKDKGYNPEEQLVGYVKTGDLNYITRHNNARSLITHLDIKDIKNYLKSQSNYRCFIYEE